MIQVRLADVTGVRADAVIRSVGTDLEACTTVCRAIGIQAGEELLGRIQRFGELPVGGAVVTPGGRLESRYLIHIVLRSPDQPISPITVARALRSGLRQAAEWQVETLAVPPLGTGAGNLDAEVSARVMLAVLREHAERRSHPSEIVIAVGSAYEEAAFRTEADRPVDPDESYLLPDERETVIELDEVDGGDWMTVLDRFVADPTSESGGDS